MNKPIPKEALDKMQREGWATVEEQEAYWREKERTPMDAYHYATNERYVLSLDETEATCEYLDEQEARWSLRDDGRSEGYGDSESYAERNL